MQPEELLEQTILGCLLSWPEELDNVASAIKVDDFYGEKYRLVYQYLLDNDGGDFTTVSTALAGKITASELLLWTAIDVIPAFLPRYCKDLKEVANKRRLYDLLGAVRNMASEKTSQEMLDKLESDITAMSGHKVSDPVGMKVLIKEAAKRLQKRREAKGAIQGIPYGIEALDEATNGMHRGELIVIAGRPSMGKSAFVGNILENSSELGYSCIMFSLEMDRGNCVDRMIASNGRINYGRVRSGRYNDGDWGRNTEAFGRMHNFKFQIDDTPGISLREIKSKCRKIKKNGLDLVAIDYLQLMGTNAAVSNRVQAIGEISRGLKQMARELDCAVALLSQLNRGVDNRPDKRPNMSDLRDSGEIEQDADVILFPFREAAYCQKCKDGINEPGGHDSEIHKHKAEIIIEKQRNGERNISVPVTWFGEFQKFVPDSC